VIALLAAACGADTPGRTGGAGGPPPPDPPAPLVAPPPVIAATFHEGAPLPPPDETIGASSGLSPDVRDAGLDADGNLWAVSASSLFLRRAGTTTFERFGSANGLKSFEILSVAGGAGGTAFVGYQGVGGQEDDPEWMRHTGGASKVVLAGSGIDVTQYELSSRPGLYRQYPDGRYMLRTCDRAYARKDGTHAGEAWFGCNHGVAAVVDEFVWEHHHATFCLWNPATQDCTLKAGDQPAVAIGPDGAVWFGGTYGVGRLDYDHGAKQGDFWGPEPVRNQKLWTSPILPNAWGSVDVSGLAAAAEGVWAASRHSGLAHRASDGTVEIRQRAQGLPSNDLEDLALDPDGGLWLATARDGVFRLDPGTGEWRRAAGLASGLTQRVIVERTAAGAALLAVVRGQLALWRLPLR